MAVNQTFHINTRDLVKGQVYGLHSSAKIIESWELEQVTAATETVAYGAPVLRTGDRKCTQADAVDANFACHGFAVRQVNREINTRPARGAADFDNEAEFIVGDTIPVLRTGALYVEVGEAVALNGNVFYDPAGGKYYATATTPTAYQLTNCKYDSTGAADGDLVLVRITEQA